MAIRPITTIIFRGRIAIRPYRIFLNEGELNQRFAAT